MIARARANFDKGEYRWVAQVMKEVVFADPPRDRGDRLADEFLLAADAAEQLLLRGIESGLVASAALQVV